jgi:hypothetical protein
MPQCIIRTIFLQEHQTKDGQITDAPVVSADVKDGPLDHAREALEDLGAVDGKMDTKPAPDTCLPSNEICDKLDNDCNGIRDDVDQDGDGLFECHRVLFLGSTFAYQQWSSVNLFNYIKKNTLSAERVEADQQTLSPTFLSQHTAIIVERLNREYSTEETLALKKWIKEGGGLVTIGGYWAAKNNANRARVNQLLNPFGFAYNENDICQGGLSSYHDLTHPILKDLTGIGCGGGWGIIINEPIPGAKTKIIASEGDPTGVVQERGKGRIFVWEDEWITLMDNPPETDKKILWRNILNWFALGSGG